MFKIKSKTVMTRLLSTILTVSLLAFVSANSRAEDKEANATGTWTWTFSGQNGQSRDVTLKLKQDGDKLTGKISGRNNDTEIEDGKISGKDVSFKVTREFNGNKMTTKYNGKLEGDTIKGKTEFTTRDGESRTRDWEAKRKSDAK
jgi:hypothetical protein